MKRFFAGLLIAVGFCTQSLFGGAMLGDPARQALIFNEDGSISDWQVQHKSVLNTEMNSGFEATDEMTQKSFPLTGTVKMQGASVIVEGENPAESLRFQAEWSAAEDGMECRMNVTDTSGQDRALTVRLNLNVRKKAWNFGNSWQGNEWLQKCYPSRSYSQVDPIHDQKPSQLPFGAVWDANIGIGMGHSMKEPRFYSYLMSMKEDGSAVFQMSVPLGLAKETENFPNQADFAITLFDFRAQDGYRGAIERYYRLFPACFEGKAAYPGAWALWIPEETAAAAADGGVGINQCEYEYSDPNGKEMAASHKAGLLVTQYSEPWGYWVPLPKDWAQAHLTDEPRKIADLDFPLDTKAYRELLNKELGDQAESDRFPGLTRDYVARAIENTAIWRNPEGEWTFNCDLAFAWGARKGDKATIIMADSNPALPSPNRWDVQMNQIDYARKIAERAGVKLNVVYLDSLLYMLGWNEYNFRRDQWKYATVPLTFARLRDGRAVPAAHQALSNVQFLKKHLEYCRKNGYLSMGNSWNPVVQYSIAYLDILGAGEHSDRRSLPPLADFATLRILAGGKPISTMDYVLSFDDISAEQIESRINYALLYGVFSGTANAWNNPLFVEKAVPVLKKYAPILQQINRAGWQVNTKTTIESEDVENIRLERWGNDWNQGLYYTIRNTGNNDTQVTVRFDIDAFADQSGAMHAPVDAMQKRQRIPENAQEIISGQLLPVIVEGNQISCTLTIPAERTVVVQFN